MLARAGEKRVQWTLCSVAGGPYWNARRLAVSLAGCRQPCVGGADELDAWPVCLFDSLSDGRGGAHRLSWG